MIYLRLVGGLGNQLFQYATALSMQQLQPDEITIDLESINNVPCKLNHFAIANDFPRVINSSEKQETPIRLFLHKCIGALLYYIGKYFSQKMQRGLIFIFSGIWNRMGFYLCPTRYKKLKKSFCRNKIVQGYFQSPFYFDHIREAVLDKFQIITPPTPSNAKLLKTIESQNAVCVHIRRGDYVKLANIHLVCNEKYYIDGMRIISEKVQKPVFYIFSDDIEWCKTNIAFEYEVIFVEGNNPDYEELRLMSACKHFVISNSTFSWWAQYLAQAPDKVVVAPSRWFNSDIKMDIWMPNWEIVEVK